MEQLRCSNATPMRLDLFLAKHRPEFTRSFFTKLIQDRGVFINQKLISKPGFLIKAGDQLEFELFAPPTAIQTKKNAAAIEFTVLDEQEEFLVINKPAGLLVHSTKPDPEELSLVDGILAKFNQAEILAEDLRAGLVHRIDKETSGLVLVAKNSRALAALARLFLIREIEKSYLAVVVGHPEPTGHIDLPLGRHPHARHKRMVHGLHAKPAFTEYKVLKYLSQHSLLEVKIKTGRTHQIRVHLAHLGFPVLGDFLYGQPSSLIARQALHAHRLEFCFRGTHFAYQAPIPADIQKIIDSSE